MKKRINQNETTSEEDAQNKRVVVKKKKRKKQKRMQRIIFIVCTLLILVILGISNIDTILGWVGIGGVENFQGDLSGNRKFQKLSIKETLYDNLSADINFSDQNVINILFFGMDRDEARTGEYTIFRPDTIILASINLKEKTVQLISVPRDSYVPIYGRNGKDKINACFYYGSLDGDTDEEKFQGGIECLEGTVSQLLGGIPINYYIGVDMTGVPQIIDTIGGVKVDVLEDIYQHGSNTIISIHKGEQVLNGEQFLYYARYREYAEGDIGRVAIQQKLLKDLFNQVKSSESIMKLPKAISQAFDIILTDMSFKQMSSLAFTLKDFSVDNIKAATVPGMFGNLRGLSYWIINQYERVNFVKQYFGLSISPSTQDPKYIAP